MIFPNDSETKDQVLAIRGYLDTLLVHGHQFFKLKESENPVLGNEFRHLLEKFSEKEFWSNDPKKQYVMGMVIKVNSFLSMYCGTKYMECLQMLKDNTSHYYHTDMLHKWIFYEEKDLTDTGFDALFDYCDMRALVCQNKRGMNVFHVAAEQGLLRIIKLLVDIGQGLNMYKRSQDSFNRTPLHWAVINNHLDIVKFLCEGEDKYFKDIYDRDNKSPLHIAAEKRYLEVIRELVKPPCYMTADYAMGTLSAADMAIINGDRRLLNAIIKGLEFGTGPCAYCEGPGYNRPELKTFLARSSVEFIRDTPEIMPIALMHLPLFHRREDLKWCEYDKNRKTVLNVDPFCRFFIKAAHVNGWTWLLNKDTMSRYTLNGLKFGLLSMWKKQTSQLLYAVSGPKAVKKRKIKRSVNNLFIWPDLLVREVVCWFGDTIDDAI
eukprot:TRINITY_DN2231_c0_g1_i3.p1 TRINITY_DN2231_c0_g1~~TRINITY_DN2231_c0_g1_i3.p1  ORF type:complete len:505 (-),score=62.33 TRINITY_DN2231_c0_g1_i3:100-1401(-)